MLVIRPVELTDLDLILALAHATGFGMTTLPRDVGVLRRRIKGSVRAFEKLADEDPPRGETYLFVMEDTDTRTLVGTCAIMSKVGGFEPFYGYQIETTVRESKRLGVRKEIKTLHLVADHDGPCEIGSLFLLPEHRRDGNGRLLSLARFLFMADHTEYFDPVVIAEMRGVVDDQGHSVFWEAVGRHFFDIDFPTADYLSGVDKRFIAELMPREPIFVPLLPQPAQDVIGKVQEATRPARKILEAEGFVFRHQVDIFDAGPVLECPLAHIRTIRDSVIAHVDELVDAPPGNTTLYLCNGRQDFRAVQGTLARTARGGVRLQRTVADALRVKPGDSIRYVNPRPA
jgi:arginine N-succinyltransferase